MLGVHAGCAVDRRARHRQDGDDQGLHVQVQPGRAAVEERQLLVGDHSDAVPADRRELRREARRHDVRSAGRQAHDHVHRRHQHARHQRVGRPGR